MVLEIAIIDVNCICHFFCNEGALSCHLYKIGFGFVPINTQSYEHNHISMQL